MRIAKVVGNVVSTIKDEQFNGHKLMIIEFVDLQGNPIGFRYIVLDCVDSGTGDMVLVNTDGGALQMLFNDFDIISDWTICGVIDHYSVDCKTLTG